MDLVSRQDLVSLARHLHRAEFLHASQQMLGQAQTRAGMAVRAPGPVFGALISAGGHVPWSPWCQRRRDCPGSRLAGRTGRHLGHAGWADSGCSSACRELEHGFAYCHQGALGRLMGSHCFRLSSRAGIHPSYRKPPLYLLDGSQRPQESLGTLLHWRVDGCEQDHTAVATLLPLARFPGSQQPAAPLQCFTSVAECQPTS